MRLDHNQSIMLIELSKRYLDENVERFNEQELKLLKITKITLQDMLTISLF